MKYSIAIHGGAGTLVKGMMTPEKEIEYRKALDTALSAGYRILENGGTALDAVETAVMSLEDCPLFNAGKGSVFTNAGTHEMDASIMDGQNRKAGAVSLVKGIKNPIQLARQVMERSEHVFMAAEGAMEFAKLNGHKIVGPDYFYDQFRYNQWQEIKDSDSFQLDHSKGKDEKFGTVGAVACDQFGNLAAATSTGGMTNKKFGRVGDSPMIGAGTYANNETCAVSCTGSGEYFIRGVVAYDVSCLIEHKGYTLKQATEKVIQERLLALGGDGGLIAVNAHGDVSLSFNTEGMYRGYMNSENEKEIMIYK
ncbi:MAG: isoaspartyl peptidase/L-asparaginase [Cryomorphaceae bacterium]|jgi:beta-aspartyl-peptidase (threonine type)|nr:isoaspartyl peptidase/L-asparaginase [Cryomorphaceae bacterium]